MDSLELAIRRISRGDQMFIERYHAQVEHDECEREEARLEQVEKRTGGVYFAEEEPTPLETDPSTDPFVNSRRKSTAAAASVWRRQASIRSSGSIKVRMSAADVWYDATVHVVGMSPNERSMLVDRMDTDTPSPKTRRPTSAASRESLGTIDELTDKCLVHLFSFMPTKEILKCARVCRRWRQNTHVSDLWKSLSFRPSYENGLQAGNHDLLVQLIGTRFQQLRLIELNSDIITPAILQELALKCSSLFYLTLDFSTAAQLADFQDLQTFPSRLKALTICLSENIFLEGLLRKIYTYISSLETLHIIGTYEKIEDEEEEVYETVNLHKLKQYTPNLRVVNLWGVAFITDEHIDSLSANCAKLECMAMNYCPKVTGAGIANLVHRCRDLVTLLCAHCKLDSKVVTDIDWSTSRLEELDISGTELTSAALISMLTNMSNLRWLKAAFLEHFNDEVMTNWLESGSFENIKYLDLDTCDLLRDGCINDMLNKYGENLIALNLGGHHRLTENFWMHCYPKVPNIRTIVMGMPEDCCAKVTAKIHVDQFIDCLASNCSELRRLEMRWDDGTLRFADKSSKFIDVLRMKCQELHSITLSDGKYYELVASNCQRAGRLSVVRTTEMCHTSIYEYLTHYQMLLFN